ncbi:MAG TPA: TatD family hydrolase [Candidatus Babeliales bacterium]|jgi:TatD DNase family protein|nr:TatD family hydrolase [Candidatus Babeliales bacterium]
MFIDTHGHLNSMISLTFDKSLTPQEIHNAQTIIDEARAYNVHTIINVGTSLIESKNSIALAQHYAAIYATVGIHPNDCTSSWRTDFAEITTLVKEKNKNKIVGIGECGIDMHYPDYNLIRQQDAFRAHIELALTYDLALVIHSRDAYDETLSILDEYKQDIKRAVMHCFSYDHAYAQYITSHEWLLGIGGTLTYPKNTILQDIIKNIDMRFVVLETDAPFLPPQSLRGKKNHPKNIPLIGQYIADARNESLEYIAQITTDNARRLFAL